MTLDEKYMSRAIDLALMGSGNVAPNPMVGAVIVCEGKIIGEGYHQKYGEAHAEVNAVNSVLNKSKLAQSTIYVTLEPCAHYGKTPPCAELLVQNNFKKVVIGSNDPFEKVNGKGIQLLKEGGIEVIQDCLKAKCDEVNKRFFTFHQKKRPYIILKWAQTSDGYIDIIRGKGQKGVKWITQTETKSIVHQWRGEEAAILVGWKTIANDNASLTVREVEGNNPLRVILDRNGNAPIESIVFQDELPTIVITSKENKIDYPSSVEKVIMSDFKIKTICDTLYKRSIVSLFIEGGKTTLEHFIESNTWDEARVFVGQCKWGNGIKAPQIDSSFSEKTQLVEDQLFLFKNSN